MPESALKLPVRPDTYRCSWQLSKPPDQTTWWVEGDVMLYGGRQPAGNVYGRAPINVTQSPTGGISYGAPQFFDYPVVFGRMVNGKNVILVDARLQVWEADRKLGIIAGANANFDAWAALVGNGIPTTQDVLVDSGVVQLTHLDAFAARAPIEETRYPRAPFEDDDPSFLAKFRQSCYQSWADAEATVAIEYQISAGLYGGYHFHVTFSPTVKIELHTPIPIKDFFTSWVLPLHGLLSASTGVNENITYWSCSPLLQDDDRPASQRQFQVFVRWVEQEPYASDNNLSDKQASAIRLAEGDSLLKLLRRWQTLESEQNPILNTYDVQSLGPEQTPRARFLLLVQALEGLCGHEKRLEEERTKFQAKRARIIADCRDALSGSDFRFLNYWLPSTPSNLSDTLAVMLRELPVDLEGELAQSDLVKTVVERVGNVSTTLEALQYVRNKLSHGTETFDPHDLHIVASILNRAVRGHLFRLLESSPAAQIRVVSAQDR